MCADLNAPKPQVELLLILAGEVQSPQLIILLLLVYKGEGEASKLRHGVALENLGGLT